ncbi:SagB-type dehydrogenase domain-containing protein [Nonomuraea pusilla]|uniref:SagB-type dehydrogenase domain-containing protein n=1 Tax=Nonomuraea pusilla TaxID=46177 RepID=A0A1H8CCF4_9ACTN|nr:SagB-type dehydrogenase domain-containing protein [Nonomuraea pusilla]
MTGGFQEWVRLKPGVWSAEDQQGRLHLFQRWGRCQALGALSADDRALLRSLAEGPITVGPELELLKTLRAGGWLEITISRHGDALYTLCPVSPPAVPEPVAGDLVLSRFAIMRREEAELLLESPLAWAGVRVHDPEVARIVAGLAGPVHEPLTPDDRLGHRVRHDLRVAGLAVPACGEEETRRELRQWGPHELWFHERSRMRDRLPADRGWGRTSWGKAAFAPLPARHEGYGGAGVRLHRPDLAALRLTDPSLTAVIEDRRSARVFDDERPIDVRQLGELLYRCARVRAGYLLDDQERVDRPYPSGGALHELELYPVVRTVAGLEAGMYHYDPRAHRLNLVRSAGPEVNRLLAAAAWAAATRERPQVLIVISARFGRVMWSYSEMAYALVLKHVGVLQQTMYLVATAMGLGACALGGGDSSAFSAATGLDELAEASVGEFMLGSGAAG